MDQEKVVERIALGTVKVVSSGSVKNTKVYLKTEQGYVDISKNVIGVKWACDTTENFIALCEVSLFASEVEFTADAVVPVRESLVAKMKKFIASLAGSCAKP